LEKVNILSTPLSAKLALQNLGEFYHAGANVLKPSFVTFEHFWGEKLGSLVKGKI
jgi:hypothetical protein